MQHLVRELNRYYRAEPALWEIDFEPEGFRWIEADDADSNTLSFLRTSVGGRVLACVANLSAAVRPAYRVGLPGPGRWREVLNTDAACFAGTNTGNAGAVLADGGPWNGQEHSAEVVLPPLGVIWPVPEHQQ